VAHSLVSDYYEARRRATAIAIYSAGCSVGQILIAFAGGWVAQVYGWRMAFVLAGIPGLILALLIRFTLREPVRGAMDTVPDGAAKSVPGTSTLIQVATRLFRAPTIRHSIIGCVVVTVAAYGTHQFTAPFFIRAFGVSYAQAGIAFGVTVGVASAIGLLLGGFLADRFAKRDARWYAGVPALGVLLSGPLYMLGFLQQDWIIAMLVLIVPGVLHFTYLGPTVSMLHNFVRADERATASAILLLLTSLIGLGMGPWIVGLMIDGLIAITGSEAGGTRQGMVISSALYLWGAGHYAWAIRTFFKDLPTLREPASSPASRN
jgi:predicted MFS family arabinose efflux permease